MGICVLGRNSDKSGASCKCGYCGCPSKTQTIVEEKLLPNPDPLKWEILNSAQFGLYCVVEMHYPDCTNYEGRKIMVFRSTMEDLKKQRRIDPHFGVGNMIYPIARFQPTREGWDDAVAYVMTKSD